MKKLVIVGAGGHGRELLEWVYDINKIEPTWDFLGFIDDNPHVLDGLNCKYTLLCSRRSNSKCKINIFIFRP